jgi:hypothetical protein
MSDEEFTLLPLIFPDDASTIAALHYPIFHLTDPDRAVAPMTEEEFIKMRTPMIIDRLSGKFSSTLSPHYNSVLTLIRPGKTHG